MIEFVGRQGKNLTRLPDCGLRQTAKSGSMNFAKFSVCDPVRFMAAPANDGHLLARRYVVRADDPLFWLDLVEVDGIVLLASRFDCGIEGFRAMLQDLGERSAQRRINTVYLDEMFDVNKYSDETLAAFANVVCESLRSRALRKYPGRSFVTEMMRAGVDGRFGIMLYEETLQYPDNREGGETGQI